MQAPRCRSVKSDGSPLLVFAVGSGHTHAHAASQPISIPGMGRAASPRASPRESVRPQPLQVVANRKTGRLLAAERSSEALFLSRGSSGIYLPLHGS